MMSKENGTVVFLIHPLKPDPALIIGLSALAPNTTEL